MGIPFVPPQPVDTIGLAQQGAADLGKVAQQGVNLYEQNQAASPTQQGISNSFQDQLAQSRNGRKWLEGIISGHVDGKTAAVAAKLQDAGHIHPEIEPHHIAAEMVANGPTASQVAQSAGVSGAQTADRSQGPMLPTAPSPASPAESIAAGQDTAVNNATLPPVPEERTSAPQRPTETEPTRIPIKSVKDFEELMKYAPILARGEGPEAGLARALLGGLNTTQRLAVSEEGKNARLDKTLAAGEKKQSKDIEARAGRLSEALGTKKEIAEKAVAGAEKRVKLILEERSTHNRAMEKWHEKIADAKDDKSLQDGLSGFQRSLTAAENNLARTEGDISYMQDPKVQADAEEYRNQIKEFRARVDETAKEVRAKLKSAQNSSAEEPKGTHVRVDPATGEKRYWNGKEWVK